MSCQPGPDSVGIFAISQSCSGVAARACGLVSLEPTKVRIHMTMKMVKCYHHFLHFMRQCNWAILQKFWQIAEILKDRPSWFRDCRSLEVFTMFPAGNAGTIELLYTQVNENGQKCSYLLLFFWVFIFPLKVILIIKSASGICSNYSCSCTGFLDSKIHYNFRQWESCGMHFAGFISFPIVVSYQYIWHCWSAPLMWHLVHGLVWTIFWWVLCLVNYGYIFISYHLTHRFKLGSTQQWNQRSIMSPYVQSTWITKTQMQLNIRVTLIQALTIISFACHGVWFTWLYLLCFDANLVLFMHLACLLAILLSCLW